MRTQLRTERGLDRLVNYTDAVVAIAITLLVLPLVEIGGEVAHTPALELVSAHLMEFGAFLMTFLVMTIFWTSHHRLFELVGAYDTGLLWLNSMWLMGIVLFPFTSELINSAGFADGAGLLYCLSMAAISVLLALISGHVRARPRLWGQQATRGSFDPAWSWIYAGYFAAVALISVPLPTLASYLLLGLFVLGRLRDRAGRKDLEQ